MDEAPQQAVAIRDGAGRPRMLAAGQAGFTLIEMLVVLAIIGMLVGLVAPRVFNQLAEAKVRTAHIQIESFKNALDLFYLDAGRYPSAQEGLAALVARPTNVQNWGGPYVKGTAVPRDPWNNPYNYRAPGQNNRPYEITSNGPGGKAGDGGEVPIRSPAGDAGADPGDRRAGYALIEVVAALAITLLILGFAFPFAPLGTTPSRLLALVSSSVSVLREARTAAIAGGKPVGARFDVAGRTLRAGRNMVAIPSDVDFDLKTGGNCPVDDGAAEILFRPDGTNCGGSLRFARGGRVISAKVNWLDGHVEVLDGG